MADLVAQLVAQLKLAPAQGGNYELSVTETGKAQPTFVQAFEQVPLKAKVQVWSPGTARARGAPAEEPAAALGTPPVATPAAAPPSFSSVVASPQPASATRREPAQPPPQFSSVIRPTAGASGASSGPPPAFSTVKTAPTPEPDSGSGRPVIQPQHQQPQGLPSYSAVQPSTTSSSTGSSKSSAGTPSSTSVPSASDWRPPVPLPTYGGAVAAPQPSTAPPQQLRPQQPHPLTPTLPEGRPPSFSQMRQQQAQPQAQPQPPQQQQQHMQMQMKQLQQHGGIGAPGSVPSYQPPQPYKSPQPTPPHSASLLSATASSENTATSLAVRAGTDMGMEFAQSTSSVSSSPMEMPLPVGAVPAPAAISSGGDARPGYERSWLELTAEQQAACHVLGYDRSKWDEERSELAASRMMADERDAEEQRRAQEAADAASAVAFSGSQLQSTASGATGTVGGSGDSSVIERSGSTTSNASNAAGSEDPFVQPNGRGFMPPPSASFKVNIIETELDEDTKKVFYVMDIERSAASGMQLPGGAQRVRKRYSEFEALRKELAGHSKSLKALEFPKKQRIKGKRGGRKEKTVDTRSSELENWLNSAIFVSQTDSQAAMLLRIIEDWFVALAPSPGSRGSLTTDGGTYPGGGAALIGGASVQQEEALAQEQADLMAAIEASNAIAAQQQTVSGALETVAPVATVPSAADEEAEMLRAIQLSLGQSPADQPPQPHLRQVPMSPAIPQPVTTTIPAAGSVNNLPATIGAIEMGFSPEKVRRMQEQQQAATGSAFNSTQELLEALINMPE